MKILNLKYGFTVAEVLLAMVLIAVISMILVPSLVSKNMDNALYAALDKNNTYLVQTSQAVQLLQMQGRIAAGTMDADRFMQAVVLTSKCIGLASDGRKLTNNKFATYMQGYTTTPARIISNSQFYNNAGWTGNTIMLKNNVLISEYANGENTYIVIDVNGVKSPNTTGKDIYFYTITDGMIAPANGSCTVGGAVASSAGCASKYLQAGKI